MQHLERRARLPRDVRHPTPRIVQKELDWHLPGELRAAVVDVAVGRDQVEPAVVVGVEEADPEAEDIATGRRQADGGRLVAEEALAEVAEEGGRLVVEVGDRQVEPAVAVEIAASDPHPRLVGARGVARDARGLPGLLEPESAQVAEQVIGSHVVGDEQVDPAVVVEVGGDDAQPAPVAIDDPRLGRSRRRTDRRRCGRGDPGAPRSRAACSR